MDANNKMEIDDNEIPHGHPDRYQNQIISPIIIEEIDSSSLQEYERHEFIETRTIEFNERTRCKVFEKEVIDAEEDKQEHLTKEMEQQLTNQFLNGELSFDEYSTRMGGSDEEEWQDEQPAVSNTYDSKIVAQPSTSSKVPVADVSKALIYKKTRRKHQALPPALLGLMGEANLRYARGENEMALKICLEIIRQVPTAAEPFITLSQIYEQEEPSKSLQFSLIAAHLRPNNAEQWIRLAVQSEEIENIKQAVTCYTKAIAANPKDITVHEKRAHLVESLGDRRFALKCYMKMLYALPPEQNSKALSTAKMIATNYHKENDIAKAFEAMDVVYKRCPDMFSIEDVNLLLELVLSLGKYSYCLEILVRHSGIVVEAETASITSENQNIDIIISCNIPATLLIDLRIKLTICLIHIKAFHLIDELLNYLLEHEDVEQCGDLFLDVAEALMKEKQYTDALRLLIPLVDSDNYSLAAVYLRYAECLKECELIDEAITSYQTVIQLAPQHLEPRLTLAKLLRDRGRDSEALAALEQDEDMDLLDPGLLYERCKILKEQKDYEQYLAVGQLLLSRHCVRIRNREELKALTRIQRITRKGEALREVRLAHGEVVDDIDAPSFTSGVGTEPPLQTEWLLFQDLILTAFNLKKYGLCQRLAFSAFGSKRFKDYARELEFTCLLTCLHNDDGFLGYNIVRDLIQKQYDKPNAWNLYNLIIQRSNDIRHNRFLCRLLSRSVNALNIHPDIYMLNGNNCLVAGTYKYALNEYVSRFRNKETPLNSFLVGVTLFQMACQKFSAKRPSLITQGIAFFNVYQNMRGEDAQHEVHYNFGRAFHQVGILSSAIHHYNKVLEITNPFIESRPEILDLRREAAFNLHLIYKKSGNLSLAKMYLHKYIVV